MVVCGTLIWIYLRAQTQKLNVRFIMDLGIVVLISGFFGARFFHVVYEYPKIYMENPMLIFDFGRGGYVYYGGFLLGILCGWIFLNVKNADHKGVYFDFFAPAASVGYALGRVACLVSGCCYGPLIDGTWGMKVVDQDGLFHFHQPTPLYATLLELIVFGFILRLEKDKKLRIKLGLNFEGGIFSVWLFLHATTRFFLEFLRADYRGPQFIFSVSAWISLILVVVATVSLWKGRTFARSLAH
jgi:phosphatidylglycerol:prolipoprotein diacylglycerol transferase